VIHTGGPGLGRRGPGGRVELVAAPQLPWCIAMASTLRKLKSLVLSQTTDIERITNLLETVAVPLHTGDCRSCADPCTQGWRSFPHPPSPRYYGEIHSDSSRSYFFGDVGHEDWKFDRDMETQMVGTVKPYIRQVKRASLYRVVISTTR